MSVLTDFLKSIAWVVVLLLSAWLLIAANKQTDKHEENGYAYQAFPDPTWAEMFPSGTNLWRSGQPDLDSLEILIKEARLKTVIRLNGSREGAVNAAQEQALCEKLGVAFYYFNIEGRGDEVNKMMMSRIRELLRQGDALVHCLHGYHRAGAAAGYYLAGEGLSDVEIIAFNGWEDLVRKPGKYRRYVDVVLREITNQKIAGS